MKSHPLRFVLTSIFMISLVFGDCRIDPLRLKHTPLVLNRNFQILYPDSRTHIANIPQNQEIYIACPGNNLLYGGAFIGEYIVATCVDNQIFNSSGQDIDFFMLNCQNIPLNIVRYTHRSCAEGGEEVEIGYSITNNVFIRQMRICFDTVSLTPLFSHYNLTRSIGYRDSNVPRIFFEEDGFYSTSRTLDSLYRKDAERRTINELLDLPLISDRYIKNSGELFINRGHLAAKGDFVYNFQQLATFHYVNSAPQWATFNGGNWNELEISLREYVGANDVDLEVYTGVHGISSLTNQQTQKKVNLFLHTLNGRNLLPVPQLFWKMIYDRSRDRGIVILGVNNAYEVDQYQDVLCSDISDKVSWFNSKLKNEKHDVQLGYIYACSIPDFRRVIAATPFLNGSSILY